jgi:hypothetical protein
MIRFMKTTTLPFTNSMNRSLLGAFVLIPLVLACFVLSPTTQAVVPAPDGGYPNGNTAEGEDALFSLTTGENNTAVGFQALYNNTVGVDNTANGFGALSSNTIGSDNTASGAVALFFNTTGNENTATGIDALHSNSTGSNNTATGAQALLNNRIGDNNTAIGNNALLNNTGSQNIAVGYYAGSNLTTGSNNIDIGSRGRVGESNTIRIGGSSQSNTYVAGINGVTVAGGIGVIVDSSGHLGTTTSSERFKDAVKPMDKASEAILALKPVTFRYKKDLDPDGIPQFGLVAEEVEKVNPDLVARDDEGKPYSVRYDAVNAMLLNEFLKEHKKVEQLQATVAQQQKDFQAAIAKLKEAVTAQLNEQAAQIQKVSAQLELSNPAPQTVLNDH